MKISLKKGQYGFTLLEVMVALAFIALALTVLLASQSQGLSLAGQAKFGTTASLLAQSKMAEIELKDRDDLRPDSGDFGEDFPDYSWELKVQDLSFPGAEKFTDHLKQVDLDIYWGEERQYQYSLRFYSFVP